MYINQFFIEILYQHIFIYIKIDQNFADKMGIYIYIYIIEAGMYYQRIGYVGYRKATGRASSVNLNHSIKY